MNPKFIKRYLYLQPGAHVVIVMNAGNHRASITSAMIAATCKLLNFPVISVTIGHSSIFLSRALGFRNVIKVDTPSYYLPRPSNGSLLVEDNPLRDLSKHELKEIVNEAREKSAILLLDTNVGGSFQAHALIEAMCLKRKETVSIVWPVYGAEDVEAGVSVINRMDPEQCMVHLYDFGYNKINQLGDRGDFLRRYPIWQSESLTQEMIEVLTRSNQYKYLPPFPELPKYYNDFNDFIPNTDKPAIINLLNHLHQTSEATIKSIFNHIAVELF